MINNWSSCQKRIKNGKKVQEGFVYTSDANEDWLSSDQLSDWIDANKSSIGPF